MRLRAQQRAPLAGLQSLYLALILWPLASAPRDSLPCNHNKRLYDLNSVFQSPAMHSHN